MAMREETIKYVVKRLGQHHSENDIIRVVVHLEDVNWNDAQHMVAEIKNRYKGQITRRQSPLLVVIGIVTFIGGCALSLSMVVATLAGFSIFLTPIPYSGNVVYFLTGLGMMAGAAYGIGPVLWDMLTVKDQED
jgi:hypothetical protein